MLFRSYKQFFPTHCNRNDYIFEDAKTYGKEGYVDITASSYPYFAEYEVKPSTSIKELLNAGVPIEHITMTSDGNGSLPHFDENGELVRLEMGQPKSIFTEMSEAVTIDKLPLEVALKTVTSNVAKILKLRNKGNIRVGADADIVLIERDFTITEVISRSRVMLSNKKLLVKGTYEY